MKAAPKTSTFLDTDVAHKRIDIRRWLSYVFSVALVVGWAFGPDGGGHGLFPRIVSALLFVVVTRLLLERLGTSRVSATFVSFSALLSLSGFSAAELALVDVFIVVAILVQEYFIDRGPGVALAVTLFVSVLAASVGAYAKPLLLLFAAALVLRACWHALLERLSKRAFVMFTAKAFVMAVIAPLLYLLLRALLPQGDLPPSLPSVHTPVWFGVIIGLLALRGAWATLLLRTDRSPARRLMRLFYVFLGVGFLAVAALVQHSGDQIFQPSFMETLGAFGLTTYTIATLVYASLAVGLFIGAGIDRSLYVDASFARSVRRWLKLPYRAVERGVRRQTTPGK